MSNRHTARVGSRLSNWLFAPVVIALLNLAGLASPAHAEGDFRPWVAISHDDLVDDWTPPGVSLFADPEQHPLADQQILPITLGWKEYLAHIPRSGWYQIVIPGLRDTTKIRVDMNPDTGHEARSISAATVGLEDWFWLDQGTQRLRLVRTSWSSSPRDALKFAQLRPLRDHQPGAFRVLHTPAEPRAYRQDDCPPLKLLAGGENQAFDLITDFKTDSAHIKGTRLAIAPSPKPVEVELPVYCDAAGDIQAIVRLAKKDLSRVNTSVSYSVFDVAPAEPQFSKGQLVMSLDPVIRAPDYGSVPTSVETRNGLTYRQSGPGDPAPGQRSGAPNWFGYRVEGLTPGKGYFLEIDYPDDATRAFLVALRDVAENGYPPSGGVLTGGAYETSGKKGTFRFPFWSQAGEARLLIFPYFIELTAAVSDFRIYEMEEETIPATTDIATSTNETWQNRKVAYWYEEGERFRDLVGQNSSGSITYTPVDRYLRLLKASGTNVLLQTMAVYDYQLFPTETNPAGTRGEDRMAAALLLGAERYGIKVYAGLHPRSDTLLWASTSAELQKRLSLSKTGKTNLYRDDGRLRRPPLFNMLHPDNQAWYRQVIRDAAQSMQAYPAFAGIHLRLTDWRNPGLNNFGSLDWGYNADITELFFADEGLAPPPTINRKSDAPEDVAARALYILSSHKNAWIKWRCRKTTQFLASLTALLRDLHPAANLLILNPGINVKARRASPDNVNEGLKEAGIDLEALTKIDGLRFVDARWAHGPRSYREATRDVSSLPREIRWSPKALLGDNQLTVWPMTYFEIRANIWPGTAIGMPYRKVSPWVSSAMEAPGRKRLARYASLLASSDPVMLGDSGNNIPHINQHLVDFLQEFRSLPEAPFSQVGNTSETLALRCRLNECYAVSLSENPQMVSISGLPGKTVTRKTTGASLPLHNGQATFSLDAFALHVYQLDGVAKLTQLQAHSEPIQ